MSDDKTKSECDKFLRIYTHNDEKMRDLGHILTTPSSRHIYQLLIQKELHAKEIAVTINGNENPKLPNVVYHLNKMIEIGLITKEKRPQKQNGHRLFYYKAIPLILLVPDEHFDKALKSKTLFTAFKTVFKFVIILPMFYCFQFWKL